MEVIEPGASVSDTTKAQITPVQIAMIGACCVHPMIAGETIQYQGPVTNLDKAILQGSLETLLPLIGINSARDDKSPAELLLDAYEQYILSRAKKTEQEKARDRIRKNAGQVSMLMNQGRLTDPAILQLRKDLNTIYGDGNGDKS